MFSENWNREQLSDQVQKQNQKLMDQNLVCLQKVPEVEIDLICSKPLDSTPKIVFIISGFPERAGVWSYTLFQQTTPTGEPPIEALITPYMEWFQTQEYNCILLDPHTDLSVSDNDVSIENYLPQISKVIDHLNTIWGEKLELILYVLRQLLGLQ